ncbi:uncharacterized protein DDB_G0290587-like [Pseudorasbora parva]|uniref:uncharacterized protein DDB_G0290587-like n=1 Tax=Pseudorasbora parva TaxID=51549 RepID=UPI00351F55BF
MEFTLLTAFLFFVQWMSALCGDDTLHCCLTLTDTRIAVQNIVGYTIQEKSSTCPLRAVRFHTKKGKVLCSDPESEWPQKAMRTVDGRTTRKPVKTTIKCNTHTTKMMPPVTTTHKTPVTETETGTSTTEPPTVTRIETSRPETEITKPTIHDRPTSCCLTVTDTRVPVENIVDYDMQDTAQCSIRAIRFHTKKNKIICSDPDGNWAKKAMEIVDWRRTRKMEPSKEATANLIPTTTLPTIPGDGSPESCCNNMTSSTIPDQSILKYHIRSHSKKMLRKFQMKVKERKKESQKYCNQMTMFKRSDSPAASCCYEVTETKIPVQNIVGYNLQEKSTICPIRAVRFYSQKGIVICSDPEHEWPKKAMRTVDGRTTRKPVKTTIKCNTHTTKTMPPVTTTHNTPVTETETGTSTTEPPTVTRIETSRPETEITKKTTNQPTSTSKENPESSFSTAITCGTDGPTSPPAETRHKTPGIGIDTTLNTFKTTDNTKRTTPVMTTPSQLKIKILRRKSKKKLKQFQMKPRSKNTSG